VPLGATDYAAELARQYVTAEANDLDRRYRHDRISGGTWIPHSHSQGQRVSIEEWKKQHHIGETTIDLTEVKPIENIVSAPDVQQAQQAQLQSYKKFAPLLAIFALILISVGFIRALKSLAWKQEVFALRVKSCA
jgi:hypothetical protein